jgi:peptidoglycan/xylan/chitin deacetylase (PgdA/CDA1 family)
MKNTYTCLTSLWFVLTFSYATSAQSWIRVNQLGYTPASVKVAVLVSLDSTQPDHFDLCDAITDEPVFSASLSRNFGPYAGFASGYRLDFSGFTIEGAYYIRTPEATSPVFRISNDIYRGAADFLLRYMRQQRCGYNSFLKDSCHTHDGYVIYHPVMDSLHLDATGGWHDATDYLQYATTSANAAFQMLLAYQQNPAVFHDKYLSNGDPGSNGIPDIIDEAKWGLDWLLKMNPDSGQLYNQVADDRDHKGFRLPNKDTVSYGKDLERPVYFCTGKPQGLFNYKNRSTGIASIAGKYSSAFAMGAMVMKDIDPDCSLKLDEKARETWSFGLANPGVCQTAPCTAPYFYEEDNWVDDMELAGAMLFKLTGREEYLKEAILLGRQETVTPWMGADTARHYQWYPFMNMGHWFVAQSGDSAIAREFAEYWKKGIENVFRRGAGNPFLNGIPFIWCSNNLTVAMLTQCNLYRQLTGDGSYTEMEAALRDWLFGCNPWGTSMIIGLPEYGDYPVDPHSSLWVLNHYPLDGGLVDGPVYNSIYKNLKGLYLSDDDEYALFQSGTAVYHDDHADYSTNEPTMDGTACLTYYVSALESVENKNQKKCYATYDHGALIRGNTDGKKLALVFTGHDQAEGFEKVRNTLKKHQVKASFFLTGDFYRNRGYRNIIRILTREGHYLGPHSDKHLLYCDWDNRDSLLVTKNQFIRDLKNNYSAMAKLGIQPDKATIFLPPYEWYNDSITAWCRQYRIKPINFTPGTSSNQDWTYPQLGNRYVSSDTIYNRILTVEKNDPNGLNGFILLMHFGTDPRRLDKFYDRLDGLIVDLKKKGYRFVTLLDFME